jgi:serine/threonine protein kinase
MGDSDILLARAKARIGTVLRDKWRLDDLLGIGGTAAVYAATHRNGKRVAIKMIHSELAISLESLQRFLREGYVANKVDHPGAVSVLDDDVSDDGSPFVVMELLQGESLEHRWERVGRSLPPVEVLWIADHVLDVLAAAHDSGVVHRDIKPDNIFLTTSGSARLLDFGIARLREAEGQTMTQAGTFMGTPAFTPPEQARGEWNRVDARTDLWAVGATMFTLLSGRYVHQADSFNMQLIAVATKPAPLLAAVTADVPSAVAAIVDKALAFDPTERWASAREMQQAVRAAGVMFSKPIRADVSPFAETLAVSSSQSVRPPALPTAVPGMQETRSGAPLRKVAPWMWALGGLGLVTVAGWAAGVTRPSQPAAAPSTSEGSASSTPPAPSTTPASSTRPRANAETSDTDATAPSPPASVPAPTNPAPRSPRPVTHPRPAPSPAPSPSGNPFDMRH